MDLKTKLDTEIVMHLVQCYLSESLGKAVVLKNLQHKIGNAREAYDYYEVIFEAVTKRVDMGKVVANVK